MNHNFIVNINSISDFSKEIDVEASKLLEILDYLIFITNDVNMFFDTPSANKMQEALLEYLKKAKTPCDELKDVSNKINIFNRHYSNLYGSTKESVGDGL